MSWNDPSELVVAGTGEVYVAPVGTALPTNESSALNAAYGGLGYHTEDGASLAVQTQTQSYRGWQSRHDLRKELTSQVVRVTFALLQWNDATLPFAFGGGAVVDLGSSHYRYDPPADNADLDERSLILDFADGSRLNRLVIKRGNVVESVESQFARSQASALPVTFEALAPTDGSLPWNIYSNDSAAYASGS